MVKIHYRKKIHYNVLDILQEENILQWFEYILQEENTLQWFEYITGRKYLVSRRCSLLKIISVDS